ncbi:TrkH family potassium uptake protein [Lederbergia wuyishanensis]|uniref:Trk-type K+ transport system membrane component n=1 Tax=Lederbergia wuyishanensis TaxID=1347903 RepID=A0ABU0D6W2_9BACI|nr:TrkH family potassium uptake protein [Lederbergia wuyishanensis]MDQ0344139.1 Trk-type K+ transport system membrane component [Lederbergia wuyishanensis]
MWGKVRSWLENLAPAHVIAGYYLLAVLISILLFSIPAVYRPGVNISLMDIIFMAVSVVSDTGMAVFNIAETFSVFGYFVIIIILQFAGIGIMAISTFFWMVFRRKIGLRDRRLIMVDNNQYALSGLVKLIREILQIIILVEITGALVFGIHFLKYFPTWQEAFLQGLFASVSATTNAGMDITGESLVPFAGDYFVQVVTMVLIVLGAIGFPVLIEVKEFALGRKKNFSLFAKLTTSTYGILLVIGTIMIYLMEFQHFFKDLTWHKGFFFALFQATTARSAGLTTMDMNDFSIPSLLVMSLFMFIGGSPNSVGGGIRTTTFALNMLFLYNFARGNRYIKVFRREIHQEDMMKSIAFTSLALIMCFISIVAISISDPQHQLIEIIVEVCSAFGTVGISLGITPDLSIFAKCILMFLMFVGRIGLTSFFFIIGGKKKNEKYRFPEERVIIG